MTDWTSKVEETIDADVFVKVIFSFFGLYAWEIFQTCDFEWSILTGRRKFQWPMVFFFLCRYSILWSLIGLTIAASVTDPINCQALYTFNSIVGQLAILTASTTLMTRTIVLWDRTLAVAIPLIAIAVGHWVLLWRGMFLIHGAWSAEAEACAISANNAQYLQATFFYTMAFDFVLLVASGYQFVRQADRVTLWNLFFTDGLIFFVAASAVNILPAVFNILNLNPAMNVITAVPAGTVSAIAACRTVIQLKDLHSDLYTHSASIIGALPRTYGGGGRPVQVPEITVKTEQIVMDDFRVGATSIHQTPARSSLESSLEPSQSDKRHEVF